ncbi:MAG: hypothetical protein K2L73_04175 [Muribaculaceae bacterium]|nr:hypothetical protein [Muribaculaceae bacterium]
MQSTVSYLSIIKRLMLPLGITWLILLFLFTGAMIAVHLIPASSVMGNTAASVNQLYEIPQPPDTPLIPTLLHHDTFTDRIILDMVRTADTSQPVYAAMMNFFPANDIQFDDTKKIFDEGPAEDYARYWHGHQIPARIAMTFITLKPLMIFNTIAGIILFIAVTACIWRRTAAGYALTFAAFILASGFPLTMWSLQLTDIYFITFIATLCTLCVPRLTLSIRNLSITFFTIGAVTTFFDFLTFPLFTLCIPLATLLLVRGICNRHDVTIATLSWGLGYGLLWASKWIAGSIITGNNLFLKAIEGAGERIGDIPSDSRILLVVLAVTAIFLLIAIFTGRRKNYRLDALLFIAALPILWFIVLKNHSTVHFFFTWRTLLITYYCITIYYLVNHGSKRKNSNPDTLLQ